MSLLEQQLKLIEASFSELEKLKKEVGRLEEIRNEIEETRKGVGTLPKELIDTFEKVKTLSLSFVESLGKATKIYIDSNNSLFYENLNDLSIRNEDLRKQIERLEKIDLEKHFDNLQKSLADIFGAISAVNGSIMNIVQTMTGIVQTLGDIQSTVDKNHKEVKQIINKFNETTEKHFIDQDKQTTEIAELFERKMKSLSEQNELIKKEIKINRIFQIVAFSLVTIILIYMMFK